MANEWTVTLNTGAKMPAFGLGTWQSNPAEVSAAVEVALRAGYRHIDTAAIYENEAEIGQAVQKFLGDGTVERKDLFITTKLSSFDHDPEGIEDACRLSLKNLQLDYIDLYLVHHPYAFRKGLTFDNVTDEDKLGYDPERMTKMWKAMESLVEKGLVKAIGVSNFTITKIENILKTAKIVPALNQVECHPYFQQPKLKAYCDSKGIVFEVYAPLGSPQRYGKGDEEPDPLADPVIRDIATKRGVTAAQICIAYQLHRGLVVIPKSVNPERIMENLKATEVKLDAEDLQRLKALDKNIRFFKFAFFAKSTETQQQIWDTVTDEAYQLQ